MIPVLARFRLRVEDGPRFGLWIPLPVVYLLLVPLLPVLLVASLAASVSPVRATSVAVQLLLAARSTSIEVETASVSIQLRIQ